MSSSQRQPNNVSGCCTPSRHEVDGQREYSAPFNVSSGTGNHAIEQASIPAQTFMMGDSLGDSYPDDGEHPVHAVTLTSFEMDVTSVTVADFARFVAATGYQTDAERFGYSAVFHLAVEAPEADILGHAAQTPWWIAVRGANWQHPGGPFSSIVGLEDHPVTHVSFNDAQAYCRWAGRSLPSEAQWEAASRGGYEGLRYPWGDHPTDDDNHWLLNIWQGEFPTLNSREDGFMTTAPVKSFQPNGYGLWQTVGNVWEWCRDGWSPRTYGMHAALGRVSDPHAQGEDNRHVMRGGSYLCHDSYCNRYRNAARTSNTADSSMGNAGFRTIKPSA